METPSGKQKASALDRWGYGKALVIIVALAFLFVGVIYLDSRVGVPNFARFTHDIGITHGSPYVTIDDSSNEVFTVDTVLPDSPAERAGLLPGDVLVGIAIPENLKAYDQNSEAGLSRNIGWKYRNYKSGPIVVGVRRNIPGTDKYPFRSVIVTPKP